MNQLNIFATLDELTIEDSVTEVIEPKSTKPAKTYVKMPKEAGPRGTPKTMRKDGVTYEYEDMTRVCDAMFIGVNISSARSVALQYERLTGDVETADKLRVVCDEMKERVKAAK